MSLGQNSYVAIFLGFLQVSLGFPKVSLGHNSYVTFYILVVPPTASYRLCPLVHTEEWIILRF